MSDLAYAVDEAVKKQLAGWQRDMGAVRRLAPKTLEAYGRDVGQFLAFLSSHTGGVVGMAALRELRGAALQWQLDPAVVQQGLAAACAQYGAVEDVFIAPYVEGPRESKVRNALKVTEAILTLRIIVITRAILPAPCALSLC